MRTEQLQYLSDLQQTRSLSKTAENYYTTHQSINNAIKALEKELNITILNRTHRGISFTEAGEILCAYATEQLQKRKTLLEQLAPYTSDCTIPSLRGELDVYIIARFSNNYFLNFFNNYSKNHTNISINVKNFPAATIFNLVAEQKGPFVILLSVAEETLYSKSFQNKLTTLNLMSDFLYTATLGVCVSSNSNWFKEMQGQNFSEELNYPSLPSLVFNYSLDEKLMLSDSCKSNFILIDNFESQKKMIKSGDYISICTPLEYELFFKSKNSTIQFIPYVPNVSAKFHYLILYPTTFADNPIIQDFIASLKKHYKQSDLK